MTQDKCTEEVKIRVSEDLKNKLFRLAENDDRALGDYIRHVLSRHVYGDFDFFLSEGRGNNGEQ